MKKNIILCNAKTWFNYTNLLKSEKLKKFNFILASNPRDLNKKVKKYNPIFIFFIHWGWKITKKFSEKYKLFIFHTSHLPYGKGGSPIQNLIIRGHKYTQICLIGYSEKIDEGNIYLKKKISLNGDLSDILKNISIKINIMITNFILKKGAIKSIKQTEENFKFFRLSKINNYLIRGGGVKQNYDRIRMLDHPDYPNVSIQYGNKIIEFCKSKKVGNEILVSAKIKLDKESLVPSFDNLKIKIKSKNFFFEKFNFLDNQINQLFNLFKSKSENYKISSSENIKYIEHYRFCMNHPYRIWCLVYNDVQLIGSFYITFDNVVSLYLVKSYENYYIDLLDYILNDVKPLPEIPSIRQGRFIVNVSQSNKKIRSFLSNSKFKILQVSYVR